jgi:hypothetical protein
MRASRNALLSLPVCGWVWVWVSMFAAAAPAAAQTFVPAPVRKVDLSGPRFGLTSLTPGIVDALAERELVVGPLISQFGWQFERQLVTRDGGLTPVTEFVVLMGGLEQGVAIPSLTWLVGMRTRQGAEFGVGPNITPAGTALAIAAGVTLRVGSINVPMNVAVVPSQSGVRVSVLTGFNFRRR